MVTIKLLPEPFRVGQVVSLNSGSAPMTVTSVIQQSDDGITEPHIYTRWITPDAPAPCFTLVPE